LADFTTMHVGGLADRLIVVNSVDEMITWTRQADDSKTPLLIISGGSNLLVGDSGFPGLVLIVNFTDLPVAWSEAWGTLPGSTTAQPPTMTPPAAATIKLRVAAGVVWDHLVAASVDHRWSGLEALSGIPGLVGAAPVQNIGAYGAEASRVIAGLVAWDRQTQILTYLTGQQCQFGYRQSLLKQSKDRYVVLAVDFALQDDANSAPIAYAELARRLGVDPGQTARVSAVRSAVLAVRDSKGMVFNLADHDSWSAGSFFINPTISAEMAEQLPLDAPRFPVGEDGVKTSAAWLIEHAGCGRGWGREPATLSHKHVLALTNRGGASASQIIDLARNVRQAVFDHFAIRLEIEPQLVNCQI
jgi:UDP-N-acetylmuramate dehydrogenase